MRFTDGYAAAPVCSPARAGLLTGRIPGRAGIYDWIPPGSDVHLLAKETTVASLLRRAGYDTCFLGKWHLNGGLATDQPSPTIMGSITGLPLPASPCRRTSRSTDPT